jgi:SOS-response transcriptional repressor LexA
MRRRNTQAIYRFMLDYVQEHGFVPTQQEIAAGCFLAQSSVSRHLDKLALWGWLEREDGKARGLHLLKSREEVEAEG